MPDSPVSMPATLFMRPERSYEKSNAVEKTVHYISDLLQRVPHNPIFIYRRLLSGIHAAASELALLDEAKLQVEISGLRSSLHLQGSSRDNLVQAFALVREVAGRTLGMYHFDAQLLGGLALHYGKIAEMQTGEGKTLTATLPASVAALSGIPVHVLTVNDYLTRRDAEEMMPVYKMLGLSVGIVTQDKTPAQRRREYACDIVYCTNKEIVFDYLKDSILLDGRSHPLHVHAETIKGHTVYKEKLLLRGLHYVITDEADSVLLDEARNPLIISGGELQNETHEKMLHEAIVIAKSLDETAHYDIDRQLRTLELTDIGKDQVLEQAGKLGSHWRGKVHAIELVHQSLSALLLFERDHHYILRDGKVQIVDENTGRIMEDRKWERGLHQLIEIKEDCEMTRPYNTLARISFQNFFRKYFHLCGMTGTAYEASAELWHVYRKDVVCIPTNKACRRIYLPTTVHKTLQEKWQKVIQRLKILNALGRPVLVGLRSVSASENLSALLDERGMAHQLLNARQDKQEADIVACAGEKGQITLATNMAGRGTDIKLPAATVQLGGLHVILTEFHDSRRIDRQLAGRCARQGDIGSFEAIVSLQDELLDNPLWDWYKSYIARIGDESVRSRLALLIIRWAQYKLELEYKRSRTGLLHVDEKQSDLLSFVGNRV